MTEFVYYEKKPTTTDTKGTNGRGRKKSFAPVRKAKVDDSIEEDTEMPFHHKGGSPPKRTREDEKEKGKGKDKAAVVTKTADSPQPATTTTKTTTAANKAKKTAGTEKKGEAAAPTAPSDAPSSSTPPPPASATNAASKKPEALAAEGEKSNKQPAKKTTTKMVKKLVPKPVTPQSDPAFAREKERFFAHFRTRVEALIDSHAPLTKSVTGRTSEVNAKVNEICRQFLDDVETTPVPTKQIPEEEYQRRQREEEEKLAESRARSVRCAKLRQRIDLLQKEIDRQQKEKAQWDDVRKVYQKKSEQIKRAREKATEQEETTAKRLKSGEIDYPDFLSQEDKGLLQQLAFTPMDVEKATQTLSLQVDYLNGTLRELKQFDESADRWVKNALSSYHKQWQRTEGGGGSGGAPAAPPTAPANARALIRGFTKPPTSSAADSSA